MRAGIVVLTLALVASVTASSCGTGGDRTEGAGTSGSASGVVSPQPPERLRTQVLETLPHDPTAFTQGFEIAHGTLYEGTGFEGSSSLRATDMTTGKERKRVLLPTPLFGEGITVTQASIWQLTWQDGIAIRRHPKTLREKDRVTYSGEGWGLCHQPGHERLVMSDGTDTLTFRDPETFERTGRIQVRSGGTKVDNLNELECVDDLVYANVWKSDTILRIDPERGRVTGEIDASGLLTEAERADADVLNGIAAIPGSDAFFVTGKLWPKIFRVRFVPA